MNLKKKRIFHEIHAFPTKFQKKFQKIFCIFVIYFSVNYFYQIFSIFYDVEDVSKYQLYNSDDLVYSNQNIFLVGAAKPLTPKLGTHITFLL